MWWGYRVINTDFGMRVTRPHQGGRGDTKVLRGEGAVRRHVIHDNEVFQISNKFESATEGQTLYEKKGERVLG